MVPEDDEGDVLGLSWRSQNISGFPKNSGLDLGRDPGSPCPALHHFVPRLLGSAAGAEASLPTWIGVK